MAIKDNGVTRIVPAGAPRDVVKGAGQVVNHLAFAFVAPLRAYDHYRLHRHTNQSLLRPNILQSRQPAARSPAARQPQKHNEGYLEGAKLLSYLPLAKMASPLAVRGSVRYFAEKEVDSSRDTKTRDAATDKY